jgi:transcriptional regulator with XRE-family HTH domain
VNRNVLNRLRVLRAERGFTQTDVARRLGYPTKFRYWEIENDRRVATPKELRKLERILGAPVAEMFPQRAA